MATNKMVWVGVALLAVMVGVAIINSSNTPEAAKKPQTYSVSNPNVPKEATLEDGDTVAETLREVQARYETTLTENADQKRTLEEMTKRLNALEGKRGTQTAVQSNEDVELLKGKLSEMQEDFRLLSDNMLQKSKKAALASGYEITGEDLGWSNDVDGKTKGKKQLPQATPAALPGYVTVRPMTRGNGLSLEDKAVNELLNERTKSNKQTSSGGLKNTLAGGASAMTAEVKPHYTIPARGTIFKAKAMTALIGTVPLGGRVQDPFPAKFIVGSENLATNGLRIPGLKGIVFEGLARGNWNLSCVSVTLTAATYTFTDGRIQHMQYDQKLSGGSREGKATSPFAENDASRGIGYITNPQGVPCIPGRRVTDAHKQLFTMGVLGAAKSYFDAKAAAETTSSTNPLGGGTTTVTGDQEAFVNNSTYGDSISTVMDFYSQRMRDTFDVIYVDPAADVSMNITQDLLIDYHSDARKLAYSTGGSNVRSLD